MAAAGTPKGQQSIFAFAGFEKRVLDNGTQTKVMPSGDEEYTTKNPLGRRNGGCEERFARACGRATHEKTCKYRRSALAAAMPVLGAPPVSQAATPMVGAPADAQDVRMFGGGVFRLRACP